MDSSSEAKLVAIIRRNAAGQFERCDEANLRPDEPIRVVSVTGGVTIIIGSVYDHERSSLQKLLDEL
jgi:hypothetical protein